MVQMWYIYSAGVREPAPTRRDRGLRLRRKSMATTATTRNVIHQWDNVDYDYPQCGGTIGTVYGDGLVEIEHVSNMSGQSTGDNSVWRLNADALGAILSDIDTAYNVYYSWRQMIEQYTEYVATLIKHTAGRIVR